MGSFEGQNQAENQPVPVEQCADRFKKLRRDVVSGRFDDVSGNKTVKKPASPAEKQIEMNIPLKRRKSPPIDLTRLPGEGAPTEDSVKVKDWFTRWQDDTESKRGEEQKNGHN